MRSLFKLSLASLAAVALFAGMALAQDKPTLTVNQDLICSLGQKANTISTDTQAAPKKKTDTAESGFISQWQADVNINAGLGDAGGRTKIRFRDDNGANPNTDRSELWYKFGASELRFHIRSWGLPVSLIAYPVYTGTTTTGGWPTDYAGPVAFWVNQSGLQYNATFSGGMNAGLAVFDACVPGCGYTPSTFTTLTTGTGLTSAGVSRTGVCADGTAATGSTGTTCSATQGALTGSTGTKATQTIVPYFYGTFGQTTVGAFLGLSSGMVARTKTDAAGKKDDDKSVTGNLTDVQAKIDLGTALVALEYSTIVQSCDKTAVAYTTAASTTTLKPFAKCDNQAQTQIALGARVNAGTGRVEVHYVTSALTNSAQQTSAAATKVDFTQNFTDIMLGYAIPMNPSFWLVPVYTSRTTTEEAKFSSSKLDSTIGQSVIALGARGIF